VHGKCVQGDRLDTDIAFGLSGGLKTVLALTGVTSIEQALAVPAAEAPHFIVDSIAVLAELPCNKSTE
jgi:ribonucleotide monophosphatase NagD (HAD superfamily)